jgi:tRNA (cmo5U34)-methyltransferase
MNIKTMNEKYSPDTLYQTPLDQIVSFQFDEQVAQVFPDMLHRSIPGYAFIIAQIGVFAKNALQDHSNAYDLGCSLGAASLVIANSTPRKNCTVIAVDYSNAMMTRAQKHFSETTLLNPIESICADINQIKLENASMVVLNFTLQFIAKPQRQALLQKIYQALRPQGILILSEKILFENPEKQQRMSHYHHAFKHANGYSELEISQKRQAIEKVLVPETLIAHEDRLQQAGFQQIDTWFQGYQFVSWVCQK